MRPNKKKSIRSIFHNFIKKKELIRQVYHYLIIQEICFF